MSLELLTRLYPDVKVRPSEEFSFSRDFPADFFDLNKLDSVRYGFSELYAYLDLPYVIDFFPNHEERREFRNALGSDVRKAYENNALRKGRVNILDLSLQVLSRLYFDKTDSDFFVKISEIRDYARTKFGADYDALTPSVKIDRAFGLKEKVVSFLNYLEVKKDTSD